MLLTFDCVSQYSLYNMLLISVLYAFILHDVQTTTLSDIKLLANKYLLNILRSVDAHKQCYQ